ncbi:unnamed protein product [Schistocephalus solidus]|uniref:3'-5' exonuclease domain-containing protein n=1 Tax=Schistocephalus solidus TaxID=70667 RepID=A0A183TFM9_SCHSO|nr:unnamed protein product [Schistocephalus solidus]
MVLNSAKCASFYVQAIGKEKSAYLRPELGVPCLTALVPFEKCRHVDSVLASTRSCHSPFCLFQPAVGSSASSTGPFGPGQQGGRSKLLEICSLFVFGWSAGHFESLILCVCAEDGLTVVDIAFANEDLLETVNAGKFRHSSIAEVQENHRRILGHPADFPVSHVPTIFSSRGALLPRSEARLRLLGLSKFDLSLMVYDVYRRGAVGSMNSAVWTRGLFK